MVTELEVDGHTMAEFRSWIQASDAIVLSTVYSGRAPKPSNRYETPAAAVARIAFASSRFQMMQLGICLLNESSEGYVARPFTIDIFPAIMVHRRDLLSKTLFDCDADHMKALSDLNFDFNRVFRFGLNWFSPKDEAYILDKMKRKRAAEEASINDQRSSMKINDPKDKIFVEIAEVVLNTLCKTAGDVSATIAAGNALLDKIPVSENWLTMSTSSEGRLILTCGTGFLCRLLHQMVSERPELVSQRVASADIRRAALAVSMSATRDADKSLVPSEVLRRKMIKELDDTESAACLLMQKQVGFRYILEEIVKAGKPIFADDLLELLLHFECILTGELKPTYLEIRDSFANNWIASSLYDTTLEPKVSANTVKVARGFEKYSQESETLEAGVLALQRASEINLQLIHEPSCRIAIPGTISEICLEEECDSFSIDTSTLLFIRAGKVNPIIDEYVRRQLITVRHADSNGMIVEAKQDINQLRSEINTKFKEKVAILFDDFVIETQNMIIPSKQAVKRVRQ